MNYIIKKLKKYIFYLKKGRIKASGKKRLISINKPAKNPNHKVANTGAVERYVFTSCIVSLLISTYIYNILNKLKFK